jgi:hypothetical protein
MKLKHVSPSIEELTAGIARELPFVITFAAFNVRHVFLSFSGSFPPDIPFPCGEGAVYQVSYSRIIQRNVVNNNCNFYKGNSLNTFMPKKKKNKLQ